LKKTIVLIAALSLSASASHAANWSGRYIGLSGAETMSTFNTGTAIRDNTYFAATSIASIEAAPGKKDLSGLKGGLQLGYNWQQGQSVFGIEVGVQQFDQKFSRSVTQVYTGFGPSAYTLNDSASTDWMATVLPHAGVAYKHLLVFATLGAAITQVSLKSSFSDDFPGFNAHDSASSNDLRIGPALGGGVKIALGRRCALRAEYLYIDFGRAKATGTLTASLPASATMDHGVALTTSLARAGIDFRF
jgi:outer membrane immunogenic protein